MTRSARAPAPPAPSVSPAPPDDADPELGAGAAAAPASPDDAWARAAEDVWTRRPFHWLVKPRARPPRLPSVPKPPPPAARAPAAPRRVIVVSSPKGGAGRTTLAAHLAVAALQAGVSTAVLDLNTAQPDLEAWLDRRRARADAEALVMPAALTHDAALRAPLDQDAAGAATPWRDTLTWWPTALATLAPACDVLIVDAPAGAGVVMAALAARADVIVSLVIDHDTEADALLADGPTPGERARPGPYGALIWNELRKRAAAGRAGPTWLLVRTRALDGPPAYAARVDHAFTVAARMMGARAGPIVREDVAWRCGASGGLTALDPPFATAADGGVATAVARILDAAGLDSLEATAAAG